MRKPVAKKGPRKPKKGSSAGAVTGMPIATLGNGIFVVRTKTAGAPLILKTSDRAEALVGKLSKALAKPGLSRRAVFGDAPSSRVYSYYVYEAQPSKMVRESANGEVTIGRVVGGRFRAD
jgi:hypothetical protein